MSSLHGFSDLSIPLIPQEGDWNGAIPGPGFTMGYTQRHPFTSQQEGEIQHRRPTIVSPIWRGQFFHTFVDTEPTPAQTFRRGSEERIYQSDEGKECGGHGEGVGRPFEGYYNAHLQSRPSLPREQNKNLQNGSNSSHIHRPLQQPQAARPSHDGAIARSYPHAQHESISLSTAPLIPEGDWNGAVPGAGFTMGYTQRHSFTSQQEGEKDRFALTTARPRWRGQLFHTSVDTEPASTQTFRRGSEICKYKSDGGKECGERDGGPFEDYLNTKSHSRPQLPSIESYMRANSVQSVTQIKTHIPFPRNGAPGSANLQIRPELLFALPEVSTSSRLQEREWDRVHNPEVSLPTPRVDSTGEQNKNLQSPSNPSYLPVPQPHKVLQRPQNSPRAARKSLRGASPSGGARKCQKKKETSILIGTCRAATTRNRSGEKNRNAAQRLKALVEDKLTTNGEELRTGLVDFIICKCGSEIKVTNKARDRTYYDSIWNRHKESLGCQKRLMELAAGGAGSSRK